MTIGSSNGAFYKDSFHEAAADWIKPEDPNDNMVVTPPQQRQNKELEQQDYSVMDGIEVKFLGELGQNDDLSWDRTEAIGRRGEDGKVEYHTNPGELSKKKLLPDEESYTLPDNPHLWIRKIKPPKESQSDLIS